MYAATTKDEGNAADGRFSATLFKIVSFHYLHIELFCLCGEILEDKNEGD